MIDFRKLTKLDEELHGEPLGVEYGSVYGADSEWSPGGYGWTLGQSFTQGFDSLDAQLRRTKRPSAAEHVAVNPGAIWGHSARCGTMGPPGECTCGASAIARAGGRVQPVKNHTTTFLFSERRGTILWTGGHPTDNEGWIPVPKEWNR